MWIKKYFLVALEALGFIPKNDGVDTQYHTLLGDPTLLGGINHDKQ